MSRSIWKTNFLDTSTSKKLEKKFLYIWSRKSVIPHYLIGFTVYIHNGKIFKKLKITREKIGFKFGFFAKTRNKISTKNFKNSK